MKGRLSLKLCCANKTSGIAIKPENETALAMDFKLYKICVSALNKNWEINKETSEKRIT